MNKLRKGTWIKCIDTADVKAHLAQLSIEGYGAVASPGNYILITAEVKEDTDANSN